MDDAGLTQEIEVFHRLLPTLRKERGDVWAVVSAQRLEGTFPTFKRAAEFVLHDLGGAKVLIRHTNAPPPHIPFVALGA